MNNYTPKNIYGNGYINHNFRMNILKDNYSFYLDDKEMEEVLSIHPNFKPNVTYKQYITYHNTAFLSQVERSLKNLTSFEDEAVILKLWANYSKITDFITGIDFKVNEKLLANNDYSIYRPGGMKDVKEILSNEFFLFDTETTGFSKLAQVIEFGGILFNRKVTKKRIAEVKKFGRSQKDSIIYLFNFISDQVFENTEIYDTIKNICYNNALTIEEKRLHLYTEITAVEKNTKLTQRIVNKVSRFDFKYNAYIHFYIKPYKDISNDETLKVHNIPIEKTIEEGKSPEEVVKGLSTFLKDKVIIAHNVSFDMEKIIELFNDFDQPLPQIKKIVDSIHIFQTINSHLKIGGKVNKYSLDYMTKLFLGVDVKLLEDESIESSKIEKTQRHTAIYDVKLTYAVLQKALEHYDNYRDNEYEMQMLLANINKQDKNKLKKIKEKIIYEAEKLGYELKIIDITSKSFNNTKYIPVHFININSKEELRLIDIFDKEITDKDLLQEKKDILQKEKDFIENFTDNSIEGKDKFLENKEGYLELKEELGKIYKLFDKKLIQKGILDNLSLILNDGKK